MPSVNYLSLIIHPSILVCPLLKCLPFHYRLPVDCSRCPRCSAAYSAGMVGRQLHCWAPNPECSLGLLGLSEVQSILVTDSQTLPLAGLATGLLADGTVGSKTFELACSWCPGVIKATLNYLHQAGLPQQHETWLPCISACTRMTLEPRN